MPCKGSRKIVVGDTSYRWSVSRWKRLSGWKPADLELLDPAWLERARQFGLGDVADVAFNICIELHDEPVSQLRVRYLAKIVDGFLGPEQFTSIRPGLIREIIEKAISAGWDPKRRGNHRLELIENSGSAQRPVLLLLPGWRDVPGYKPRMVPLRILPEE